jgi:hypothetical protein
VHRKTSAFAAQWVRITDLIPGVCAPEIYRCRWGFAEVPANPVGGDTGALLAALGIRLAVFEQQGPQGLDTRYGQEQ